MSPTKASALEHFRLLQAFSIYAHIARIVFPTAPISALPAGREVSKQSSDSTRCPVAPQAFPRHGYILAYPELLLTSAQRVFVSHKSKYQLKLFVTTILAKLNVVQAEDARSRAWPCSYERHVCEKLGFPLQESDVNRIHVALLK